MDDGTQDDKILWTVCYFTYVTIRKVSASISACVERLCLK